MTMDEFNVLPEKRKRSIMDSIAVRGDSLEERLAQLKTDEQIKKEGWKY